MNPVIDQILNTKKTITPDGEEIKLTSGISRQGGQFLFNIINDHENVLNTLEIGCANGISSLHICEALINRKEAHHTIIDPFQSTDWKSAGIYALQRAGFTNFTLLEKKSEFILPELLTKADKQYDFIFIDGWHTFDHVMLESFYATRLLKTGGFLVFDDADTAAIAKVVKYLANYPCYKYYADITDYPRSSALALLCRAISLIPLSHNLRHRLPKIVKKLNRKPNIIALQKTGEDERSWYWYKPF